MRQKPEKALATQTNQSSDKLLALIELLAQQPEPIRLQDISRISGMNASTALRFLSALQHRDYAAQEIDTGRYYLTFKLCGLAQNITSHFGIREIAQPFIRNVSNVFSESCHLAVESDLLVLYIDVAKCASRTLMITQRIGNLAPLHCTGVGKLFLSQHSVDEVEGIISQKPMQRLTENTITTIPLLLKELDHVRNLGYAYDNEECEVGARCIAAPIRDYTGNIVAGISVSGPAVRMTDEHIMMNLPFLMETAEQISVRLGWQG